MLLFVFSNLSSEHLLCPQLFSVASTHCLCFNNKAKSEVIPKVPSQSECACWQPRKPRHIQMSHAVSGSRTHLSTVPAPMVQYDVHRCYIKSGVFHSSTAHTKKL